MPTQSANDPELMTLDQWKGLNQQSKPGSIDDQEEVWDENYFAVGPGNMRTCWGKGPEIYHCPPFTQILRTFFGFYGNQTPRFAAPPPGAMGWMFLSDGTIDEVDLNTGQVTGLRAAILATTGPGAATAWNPIAPYYWAAAKVWRPQYFGSTTGALGGVLFGSPTQNNGNPPGGLYAWNGTVLSIPGGPAPAWLTNGATPAGTMPIGLPGIYAMEVYQSRLWVAGKDVMSFSAPSNGALFSTISGGGSFGFFGDNLTYSFVALHAVAGYLFVYGDSSTWLISNLQLTGSGTPEAPYTTNFNFENIDPQVGQRFPRPVGTIGRDMILFNNAGLFRMQGGDAVSISEKISNLWASLDPSLYYPTFAPATMFGFRVLLVNGRFTDVFGVKRSLLLMWHPVRGKEFWSVASQGIELTNIGTYEQDSSLIPYGTDGFGLYQLFAAPDPTLLKTLITKQIRGKEMAQITIKNWKRAYAELADNYGTGVSITGNILSGGGGVPGGTGSVDFNLAGGAGRDIVPFPLESAGIWALLELYSQSPDFTIERIHLTAHLTTLYGA